ncbi:hypothetical protein [Pseudodonghicola flavimaris]|uniref:Pilus assembly protein PilP n=1 Tax=Pseudodonghicola flavimaris TaxID=3050036 RepID=A0ABT7EV59_9RHOB|nr:hypothetical protein [Pseudodonghicola flavimaris]MDK3016232.1 hypothetical protein [Pseudodonghicola flavimaris]
MTSMSKPGVTPDAVARLATTPKAIDDRGLALIGLSGGAGGGFRALVRLPGGRIKEVEAGSRLPQGRITAIDGDGLILDRNGKSRRLGLPGG